MTSIFECVWAHDTTSEPDGLYYPLLSCRAHIAGSEARGPRRGSGPYLIYLSVRFGAYHREAVSSAGTCPRGPRCRVHICARIYLRRFVSSRPLNQEGGAASREYRLGDHGHRFGHALCPQGARCIPASSPPALWKIREDKERSPRERADTERAPSTPTTTASDKQAQVAPDR
jgi:hypothetical protein